MIYLAYFIFAFAIIQMIVAIINVLLAQKLHSTDGSFHSLVSVLIPARNEENNIASLLNDLLNQDYQNIEIIVFNDLSTDRTEEIVSSFVKSDKRVRLINSDGLTNGWLGKNFACHNLAKQAQGEYLLFVDADVRIKGDVIINSISIAEKHQLGLLSVFPKQLMKSGGEYLTVPVMNYILLTLLPLVLVHKSKNPSLAAANGQFMLFKRASYIQMLPHEKFKSSKVEDIDISRFFKTKNIPIACLLGDHTIECRMYNSFTEAVNGFSKNVVHFFGNSFLAAFLFWGITTLGFIVVVISFPLYLCCLYLLIVLMTKMIVSIISKQNILMNTIFFLPQQITLGMLIYKALLNRINKQYQWKGRSI
jgi:glycosyltransferase involved in cell wall biosynthesis